MAGMMITTSCHKSKHSAVTTPVSNINGLTAMRHRTAFDTGFTYASPYITWNFSGTNPIEAMPNTDTFYFGHQQLSFTGSNATQLVYYNNYSGNSIYSGLTTNISYTTANQIDTITFQYTIHVFGAEKIAFQYSGDKITKVIVAHTSNVSDTFHWSTPDVYHYTYTGNNISQISILRWFSTDSEIHNYFMDSRSNNFAGSIPTFLLLEFLQGASVSIDPFLLDMPFYTNANIVDSVSGGTVGGYISRSTITTITDATGRITQHIFNGSSPDTVFYSY